MLILPTIDETPDRCAMTRATSSTRASPPTISTSSGSLAGHAGRHVGDHRAGVRGDWLAAARREAAGRSTCVSEVVRLTLVSHAMTDAMAAGRFPTDEPLNCGRPPPGRRVHRAGRHRTRLLRTGETHQADRRTARAARQHRQPAGRSGLRPLARRCGGRGAARRSGDLADRPDAGAARRRVGRRADRPGARMDGFTDHPSHPAGRRHASGGDPCRDPGGTQRAAEVVLAHRHCAGEPHGDALPRARLDAALQRCELRPTGTRSNAWCAIDSSQAAAVGLRKLRPVQLEADHPRLARCGRPRTS